LLECGRAAAAEASPQTGDGRGVSNTRLVLDLNGAERGEQLFDEVIFLVVQCRAAQTREPEGAPVLGLPALGTSLDNPVGDHVHRRVEVEINPVFGITTSVLHPVFARGSGGELERG